MNKNVWIKKRNKESKLRVSLLGALIWISEMICIALCIALLFAALSPVISNIYQSSKPYSEAQNPTSGPSSEAQNPTSGPSNEDQFLSAGIAIIGLAISVWGGLNIVNSIERKDLEELRSRTDSIKQLVYNMDNIESLEYDAFLQALLRKGNDELTIYFYRKFSRYSANAKENFFTLTRIEDLFGQVYDLHNTVEHHDAKLIEKAKDAIACIEEYHTNDRLIRTYLTLRNAELHYYCGYVGESEYQKFGDFSSAFDLYQKSLPELDIIFPKRAKDGQIPELRDGIDRKLAIYMANTLGDTCSKILPLKKQLTSKSAPEDQQIEESVLERYAKNAIFYCECATKWADKYSYKEIYDNDYHYFEVYYRNYAVAYERYDNAYGTTFAHAEIIIENYLKAFYHTVKGTKLPLQRVQSIYHALLSYLNRYFEDLLKFEQNDEFHSPLSKEEVFEIARQKNTQFDDTKAKHLQEMLYISKIGMMDTPRNNLPVVMSGFAYSYVILLKLVGNSVICKQFTKDCVAYLTNMQNALSWLKTLNIQDDYTRRLRNRCQLITECVKQAV